MQEQDKLTELIQMRRLATGLLLVMVAVFLLSRQWQSTYDWLSFVRAFAEAAMVGALADWFAVTALFRRPMGLPIPHTAVIPNNKDRIGDAFARFLENNFLTPEVISREVQRIDFAGAIAQWVMQPGNARLIAMRLLDTLPFLFRVVDEGELGASIRSQARGALRNTRLAPFLAQALSVLVADRRHQFVLEYLLDAAAQTLEAESSRLRDSFVDRGPWWLPKAVDKTLFDRMLTGVQEILQEIRQDNSHWRARFQEAAEGLIDKLRSDPAYEAKIADFVEQVLNHPVFRAYAEQIWQDIKQRVLEHATDPDSQTHDRLEAAVRSFSVQLLEEPGVREKINDWLRNFAMTTLIEQRQPISALAARVIRSWDSETMARRFELQVGTDLQYIRINGTLVGGLVGLLLHLFSRWF